MVEQCASLSSLSPSGNDHEEAGLSSVRWGRRVLGWRTALRPLAATCLDRLLLCLRFTHILTFYSVFYFVLSLTLSILSVSLCFIFLLFLLCFVFFFFFFFCLQKCKTFSTFFSHLGFSWFSRHMKNFYSLALWTICFFIYYFVFSYFLIFLIYALVYFSFFYLTAKFSAELHPLKIFLPLSTV